MVRAIFFAGARVSRPNRFMLGEMPEFTPDSPLVSRAAPSPNHGERHGGSPDMIVLHYTGMPDATVALDRLCDPASQVSAHYLVFEDGRIIQCVAEAHRAWHAGESLWGGDIDINSRSIGIEIANPGHDGGYPDFPATQVDAVIALCRDIRARHAISAENVLAHSDVAPGRKNDPGEKFPWEALHRAGIGLWVKPHATGEGDALALGVMGPAVEKLQENLSDYGYGLAVTGDFDAQTENVVRAFQRHFRPACVDGIADRSTTDTLADLLAARRKASGA